MEKYRFVINEGSPDCFGHPKLFAHVLLERNPDNVYDTLDFIAANKDKIIRRMNRP